jgi:hypothetical protein
VAACGKVKPISSFNFLPLWSECVGPLRPQGSTPPKRPLHSSLSMDLRRVEQWHRAVHFPHQQPDFRATKDDPLGSIVDYPWVVVA